MVLDIIAEFAQTVMLVFLIILSGVVAYNMLILAFAKIRRNKEFIPASNQVAMRDLKIISLIIPVRDEFHTLPMLLKSIRELDYPSELFEVIFVFAKDSEKSLEKCRKLLEYEKINVKFLIDDGKGKPAALNIGLKYAVGEIIGVFDVDSILPSNILLSVSRVFSDNETIAMQGVTSSYNEGRTILSKLASLEEKAYFRLFVESRARLDLFIPCTGSCFFIKKDYLLKAGGWRENLLTEDVDLALRLLKRNVKIRFEPSIYCKHETPSRLTQYLIQRLRWFRGFIQLLPHSLRNLLSLKSVDAFLTLLGPVHLSLSLITFLYILLLGGGSIFKLFQPVTWFLFTVGALSFPCLVLTPRSNRFNSILIISSMITYWILESFIATVALLTSLLRIRIKWIRTPKDGITCSLDWKPT